MAPFLETDLRYSLKGLVATQCQHTLVVEEFGVERGGARIDLALIANDLHGYEIKSDLDNLDRLRFQIHAFNRVFDRISLVVGNRFARVVEAVIPAWWGILRAIRGLDGSVTLAPVRPASQNLMQDPYSVAALLWKDEVLSILSQLTQGARRFSSTWNKDRLYSALADSVPLDTLRIEVAAKLRLRRDWRTP